MIELANITTQDRGIFQLGVQYKINDIVHTINANTKSTYIAVYDSIDEVPYASSKWKLVSSSVIEVQDTDSIIVSDGTKYVGVPLPNKTSQSVYNHSKPYILVYDGISDLPSWELSKAHPKNTVKKLADTGTLHRHTYGHMGAILDNGQVAMWGRGESGNQANGRADDNIWSMNVQFPSTFVGAKDLYVRMDVNYVRDEENRIWHWGYNWNNSYAGVNIGETMMPTLFGAYSPFDFPHRRCKKFEFSGLHNSEQCGAFLDYSGELFTFGRNNHGQCATGSGSDFTVIHKVDGLWKNIWVTGNEGGAGYMFGVREDDVLLAWGRNVSGQLGVGDLSDRYSPTPVIMPEGRTGANVLDIQFIQLQRGASDEAGTTFILFDDYSLWIVGRTHCGIEGQGHDSFGNMPTMFEVKALGNANNDSVYPVSFSVAGGYFPYAVVIMSDGTVRTWGHGESQYDMAAHGHGFSDIHTPTDPAIHNPAMNEAKFIKAVTASYDDDWKENGTDQNRWHRPAVTYLLREDGVIFSSGFNYYANLGRLQTNHDTYHSGMTQQNQLGVSDHAYGYEYNAKTRWETKWREKPDNYVYWYHFFPVDQGDLYFTDIVAHDHSTQIGCFGLTREGHIYGWGNNEENRLGSHVGGNIGSPQKVNLSY